MVTTVRWIPDTEGDRARQRLITAAEACVDRYGVAKTTVEDVALAAGVSRATAYRYVSGRDEVILAVLMRELGRLAERIRQRSARSTDVRATVITEILYAVRSVRRNDKLLALLAPDRLGLPTITGAHEAVWEFCSTRLLPLVEGAQARGLIGAGVDARDLVEFLLRLGFSLLVVDGPAPRSDSRERAFVAAVVRPLLDS